VTAPDIVLLAHGSPDPRHRAGVETLAEHVRSQAAGRAVHTAYLDHHPPTPADVARGLGPGAVVVPVLLTPAYHARVDVPAAVRTMAEASGSEVVAAEPLGPHPLLLAAVEELLADAGHQPSQHTAVVVYAAGSSDSGAVASVGRTIEDYPPQGWGPWVVAALDGGATLTQAQAGLPRVVERVVAVSFMVAEGILRDRMAQNCADDGVEMVPGGLASTHAVARLVLERADNLPG
jgi:sirohydrochlorin ferrochelatase